MHACILSIKFRCISTVESLLSTARARIRVSSFAHSPPQTGAGGISRPVAILVHQRRGEARGPRAQASLHSHTPALTPHIHAHRGPASLAQGSISATTVINHAKRHGGRRRGLLAVSVLHVCVIHDVVLICFYYYSCLLCILGFFAFLPCFLHLSHLLRARARAWVGGGG